MPGEREPGISAFRRKFNGIFLLAMREILYPTLRIKRWGRSMDNPQRLKATSKNVLSPD